MWKREKQSYSWKSKIEESSSKLNASNETLLISFLRPSISSLRLIDLSHRPHFYRFNPVCSPRKSFLRLKRKRDGWRERTRRPEKERAKPRRGEPTPVKRDDIENFGGNWLGCKGITGGKRRKVERLTSMSGSVCQPEIYYRSEVRMYVVVRACREITRVHTSGWMGFGATAKLSQFWNCDPRAINRGLRWYIIRASWRSAKRLGAWTRARRRCVASRASCRVVSCHASQEFNSIRYVTNDMIAYRIHRSNERLIDGKFRGAMAGTRENLGYRNLSYANVSRRERKIWRS